MANGKHDLRTRIKKYFELYPEMTRSPAHFLHVHLKIKRTTLKNYLYEPRNETESERSIMLWDAIDKILAELERQVITMNMIPTKTNNLQGLLFILKAGNRDRYIPELKFKQELDEKAIERRDNISINFNNEGNNLIKGIFKASGSK